MLRLECISNENYEAQPELVFFDTFSHDNTVDFNLDLVQFRNPVLIKEIRIIPLGAKVEADFPGGCRLGATNPSSFDVIFYINDLTKTTLNKFLKFGSFSYKQNVNIKFTPSELRPTDSLVLKGKYTNLTLAIFAEIVKENSILNTEKTQNSKPNLQIDDNIKKAPFSEISNHEQSINLKSSFDNNLNGDEKEIKSEAINSFKEEINVKEDKTINLCSETQNPAKINISSPIGDEKILKSDSDEKNEENQFTNLQEKIQPIVLDSQLENIADSDNDSLLLIDNTDLNKKNNTSRSCSPILKENANIVNESDLEPISPEQFIISDLTENVSDDEIFDCTNDNYQDTVLPETIDINEINLNNRVEDSNTSTNGENLEAISSEEEYFEEASNDGDILVDYSDDEFNKLNYLYNFNVYEYSCEPLSSIKDSSLTNYENVFKLNLSKEKSKISDLYERIFELDNEEKDYKWIEFIENLTNNITYLNIENEYLFQILLRWIKLGIDFETAIKQKQTAFRVRHLKAGLKLLGSVAKTTHFTVEKLLNEKILIELYNIFYKPHMSFPIKLLIIQVFDVFVDNPLAIEHILNHKYEINIEEINQNLGDNFKTMYQLFLILMMNSSETRVITSLTILLRKIHFFEFLQNFKVQVKEYLNLNENEELLINNLKEITTSFKFSQEFFSQRLRYLPASTQFDVKSNLSNVPLALYKWFNYLNLYDLLIELYQKNCDKTILTDSILNFINEILNQSNGPAYLLSKNCFQITNKLLNLLLDEKIKQENSDNKGLEILNKSSNSKYTKFAIKIKYTLKTLQLIDKISLIQTNSNFNLCKSFNEVELCSLFNKLYSLLLNQTGSCALVKVFCDDKNLDILINYLLCSQENESVEKIPKFVCFNYVINLLLYVIQHSKEKFCELLLKYDEELIVISNFSYSSKFTILSKWLSPLKRGLKFSYNETMFKLLVSNLKQHSELIKELRENCTYKISPDLISCVQILNFMCVNKQSNELVQPCLLPINQLKYKYGLIQLFNLKGIQYILTILDKISEIFLKPSHQNVSLVGNHGFLIIALFEPCIEILKQILLYLTYCRGSDFKDTSPISTLLKVFSLMLIFPLSSPYHNVSVQICNEVIGILLSYTQLNVNINEVEDEVFNKSIWTKMVKEVINYTTLKPFNFSHGLYLLSELLPMPLSVKKNDQHNELSRLLNFRKLWSAHIYVLFSDMESLIHKLILCSSPLIQCLLRRVCYQLVDLSSHAGMIVSKCLLSALDKHLMIETNELNENLICILNLVTCLLNYNLFRHALTCVVNTISYGIKKDEKFENVINRITQIIKSNENYIKNYSAILNVLDSKTDSIELNNEQDNVQMDQLNNVYNNREEIVYFDEDFENLSKSYLNLNVKLSRCDFITFAKKYFKDNFNIRNQLLEIYKNKEFNYEDNFKSTSKHKYEPLITKDYSNSVKRPYVAPLRGRGFQRTTSLGIRLHDPFRSRPPNTSRPPSMHVDDFVVMEQNSQNNIKRQKQDFNKYKSTVGQRNNLRTNYFNANFNRPANSRTNLNTNKINFNRYLVVPNNYNSNNVNISLNNLNNTLVSNNQLYSNNRTNLINNSNLRSSLHNQNQSWNKSPILNSINLSNQNRQEQRQNNRNQFIR